MACELLAWMQMLTLDGPARAWEPKRLRLRLFSAAGRLISGGRAWPRPGPGPPSSPPRSPACRPSPRLTSQNHPYDQEGQTQGLCNPARRGATAGKPGTARN
jgi:hypothetical protein